jgi:phospho-N-acetylmuramoyl-pentapeptide-transferase
MLYPLLLAFALSLALFPVYIAWLKANEIRQFIRVEGPASHQEKARTPTTGGVCFIVAIVITYLVCGIFFHYLERLSASVLILALLCALTGFADDLAKLRKKANAGLSASLRLVIEVGLGVLFALSLLLVPDPHVQEPFLLVPVRFGLAWSIPPWLFVCLSAFLVSATTNALNLHDGMDGLAAGTSVLVLAVMAVILMPFSETGLAPLALATVGALLGFLLFNKYPAKIFMGDTGSLFLGGLMAGLTLVGGFLLWFVPLTVIYIAEALSVIAQVSYFKLTKPYLPPQPMSRPALIWLKLTKRLPGEGKRLLRMAPLHHHFEALMAERGVPEWQVVAAFWGVQLIVSLAVLAAFFAS